MLLKFAFMFHVFLAVPEMLAFQAYKNYIFNITAKLKYQ